MIEDGESCATMWMYLLPLNSTVAAATAKSLQSCPILCDPVDCSLPGSSVHGIFQARVPEWGAIPKTIKVMAGQTTDD